MSYTKQPAAINRPVQRMFVPRQFIHGGGVAIFHVKSERVVVVNHTREKHWFLPKGRKDVGEGSAEGAEREGFEESGFRNRILPLPLPTVQTWDPIRSSRSSPSSADFHTEPLTTILYPMGRHGDIQYICSWYVAETLPPDLEAALNAQTEGARRANPSGPGSTDAVDTAGPVQVTARVNLYARPPASRRDETLEARMAMEPDGWEPVRVERSTTQSDELYYQAHLLPIAEAVEKLRGTGWQNMDYIVLEGWKAIQKRLELEREWEWAEDKESKGVNS